MASVTELLRLVIKGDSSGAVAAIKDVSGEATKADTAFGKYGASMNTAANYAAGAVVGLTAVIGASTRTTIAYGESVDSVTDITNLSAESASRLVGQWRGFGVTAEEGANSVKFFEKNLDAARQGSTEMAETFGRLGISMSELQSLSDEDILARTRDGLSQTADGGERSAIALKLMGRSATALADWYNAAPDDMARVNEQLEKTGHIWGDDELATWQKTIDAQRNFKLSLEGLQFSISQNVLPSLSGVIDLLTKFIDAISPLAPVLVPAAFALGTFAIAVKGVLIAKEAALAIKGLYAAIKSTQILTLAANGFRILATQIGMMAGAAGISVGVMGALAIAIPLATAAVVGAVWAWNEWRNAVNQANEAYEGAMANLEKNKGKLSPEFYEQKKADIEADKYEKPWYMFWAPTFATGGDFVTSGPQAIVVGDNPSGKERVSITPLDRAGRGGKGTELHMHFHGPVMGGRAGIREFMKLAGEEADLAIGGLT